MKRSSWYKVTIRIVAPLLLLGGMIGVILLPRALAGRRALDRERRRFFEFAEEIRGLASLRQKLNQVSPESLETLFIPKDRPLAFVEMLEALALQNGMNMEIVFLDPSSGQTVQRQKQRRIADDKHGEKDADTKKAPAAANTQPLALEERGFEVRLRGSFQGAMRFLAALEHQEVLLRVDRVTVQAIQERNEATPRLTTIIRFYAPTRE